MNRRDILATTAMAPFMGFTPRVPKNWSDLRHSDRLIIFVANGPSNDVGSPSDTGFAPRYPSPPPGTPPNRIVG